MIFPVGRFEFARCMMWPAASLALLTADRAIATIDDGGDQTVYDCRRLLCYAESLRTKPSVAASASIVRERKTAAGYSTVKLAYDNQGPLSSPTPAVQSRGREPLNLPLSGSFRRFRGSAIVVFTWPIEWMPGQVLSRLRGTENAHDQLDQLTEPERFADKARVSLDVGAHAIL